MRNFSLKKNIIMSVAAQAVTLLSGMVLQLLVPKFIDAFQYSYWQMYVLYSGYIGVLHFGLLDGIILNYSQYDFDELDKPLLRSQFVFLLLLTSSLAVLVDGMALTSSDPVARSLIILIAFSTVIKNVFTYSSYSFQITNRIKMYANQMIVYRASYAVIVVVLIVLKVNNFWLYCAADLIGNLIGIVYAVVYNRQPYFGELAPASRAIKEVKKNISSGLLLMLSNWTANFLVGAAKMVVQWRWDTLVFGLVSFGFSVTNLFLVFSSAVGVVLFPSIKRIEQAEYSKLYQKIRLGLTLLFLALMLGYFPMAWILRQWLPVYAASLQYVGLLLPVIVFSSRISILTNTFLKAYRMEKSMFVINISSLLVAFVIYLLGAYLFENMNFILLSVSLVTFLRSFFSERVLESHLHQKYHKSNMEEFIVSVLFIIATQFFSLMSGFVLYAVVMVVYCYRNRLLIKNTLNKGSGSL